MPCNVSFEPEGLYVKFSQLVTAEDIVVLIDAMQSSKAEEFKYRLTDCLEVSDFHLTEVHVAHILSLDYVISLDGPYMRRAVVATDPVLIGKIREWANKYHLFYEYKLFATLAAAREWLTKN